MIRTDVFEEIDNQANEIFEFIRFTAQMGYSEDELRKKSLTEFFDILKRANKKIEELNNLIKKKTA